MTSMITALFQPARQLSLSFMTMQIFTDFVRCLAASRMPTERPKQDAEIAQRWIAQRWNVLLQDVVATARLIENDDSESTMT